MKTVRRLMLVHALGVLALVVLDHAFPLPADPFARLPTSPHVTAADGTPMHTGLTGAGERVLPCSLPDVSPHVIHAAIAAEDRRFLRHDGVDPRAVVRAGLANLSCGARVEGASTITMQVARLVDPQPRDWPGKIVQAFRAWQLERRFDKAFLLERYLEHVPLGGNVRGVEAAARALYGKTAATLDAAEAALLVSLLPSPTRFLPWRDPAAAVERRNAVLEAMRREGYLDDDAWADACARPLGLHRLPFPDVAPHAWLRALDGETTIEVGRQGAVERIAAQVPADGVDGLAIVVLDNETSAVRALAGATAPDARLLDATGRPRSAGSTLKPFLYALAFDRGLAVPDTKLLDLPWQARDWAPGNFDDAWRGPVPAGEALASSRNLPAIRLAAALPRGTLPAVLRRAGLAHVRPATAGASIDLAIGTDDVTPLELAGAYAAMARGGRWIRPWLVATDRPTATPRHVCSPGAAALVTQALSDRTRPRPEGAPRQGVAWKTGTSSRRRDAWAAGYTSRVTAVVWRGRLDGRPHPSLVGARAAEPLLFAVLQAIDPQPEPFGAPKDVARVEVCSETGLARGEACPAWHEALRPRAARPLKPCDVHVRLAVDATTGRLRCDGCRKGHEVVSRTFAVHRPVLSAWRRQVGLAVEDVPAHAEDCPSPIEPEALEPLFLAPRDGQTFRARGEAARVPVRVLTAGRPSEVHLLVDGRRASPPADHRLSLEPGAHTLTVVAGDGRSVTVRVAVRGSLPRSSMSDDRTRDR